MSNTTAVRARPSKMPSVRPRESKQVPVKSDNRFKRIFFSKKAAPYIFVLPFIVSFLIFWGYPIGRSIYMSFHDIMPGYSEFIGVGNFRRMFNDRVFWIAIGNSVRYMAAILLILIPVPLALAVAVNSKIGSPKVKAFFKSAMFVPALTSVVVAGIIFRLIFSESSTALMNQVVGFIGIEPQRWLRNDLTGLAALLVMALWRWAGVNMMYFLAGLQAIPEEYYEAAALDGANKWQIFWNITLPSVRPTITFVTTITIFGGLAMFLESFMLWDGNASPNNIGLTIVGYLYRMGFERGDMGFASAVGVVLLATVLMLNLVQLTLSGFFKKEKR